jgi:hypothetical protein
VKPTVGQIVYFYRPWRTEPDAAIIVHVTRLLDLPDDETGYDVWLTVFPRTDGPVRNVGPVRYATPDDQVYSRWAWPPRVP